jgi:hypothetical protein
MKLLLIAKFRCRKKERKKPNYVSATLEIVSIFRSMTA